VPDAKGVWRLPDRQVASQHKLNIGAIVSDASVMVQYGPAPRGAKLGTVEESFVARMKAGDKFWFAGRPLEFVRLRDQTAFVRAAMLVVRQPPGARRSRKARHSARGSSASLARSALLR
jgi:ATP-dependent helicase Lhr and Lhr-like helicase